MKLITDMEDCPYTPHEVAAFLKEYEIPMYQSGFQLDTYRVDSSISKLITEERNKLTHNGLFHNAGNSKEFIKLIIKRFGEENITQYSYTHRQVTEITLNLNGHMLELEVADDHVKVKFGYYSGYVHIGLHSNFLDEVMGFLFDEDGEFVRLVDHYHKLRDSMTYYNRRFEELMTRDNYINALADKTLYKQFQDRFADTLTLLKPLGEYLDVNSFCWDKSVRTYGISYAISELSAVRRLASGKTSDKCARYQKRYEKAIAALTGANERSMLTPDEANLLVAWPDFVAAQTSEDALKENSQNYIASIDEAYAKAIRACEASHTAYMRKKKLRLEANIDLCKKLKAAHGLDCYIDNSQFDSSVGHFNVVTDANMVWAFRISRTTPSFEEGEVFINIVKALEQIGKTLHKNINLHNITYKSQPQFHITKDRTVDSEVLKTFQALTKKIKNGWLDITKLSVKLGLPIGSLEWQISLRRKTAIENLSEILPYIHTYMKLSKNGVGIDFKGIFKERKPRL